MKAEILNEKKIEKAAKILKNSGLVVFPTETVYGVGALANKNGYEELVKAKRRPPEKPFTIMLADKEDISRFAKIGKRAKAVINAYMPGMITILLAPLDGVPSWITLSSPRIGIRIPDSQYVLDLIRAVGEPLFVTSANKSGETTPKDFEEAYKSLGDSVSAVVKGQCSSGLASTIVDVGDENDIKLIREGPIPFADIKKIWEEAE